MRHQLDLKFFDMIAREGSIRKAADKLAITSTALNRRILALEEELGHQLFERSAQGVQLNAAGEIFLQYARDQINDLSRIRSRIADLSGVRRGHINISSCSEALDFFLSQQIADYRREYPQVSFAIDHHNNHEAEKALIDKECDIAIMVETTMIPEFEIIASIKQTIHCMMAKTHPLAEKQKLKLSDFLDYPMIMPQRNMMLRQLLDMYLRQRYIDKKPDITSDDHGFIRHYLKSEDAVSFQIPIALPNTQSSDIIAKPLLLSQPLYMIVQIGHLRGRALSVAAAKFLQQLLHALSQKYPDDFEN